ncbi:B-box zinc finger protein [Archangium sp.]|uniref:B-box zinc finger protein n=1 Tax=Archangium sp. TaxID=1872627 RepID=UPI003899AF96
MASPSATAPRCAVHPDEPAARLCARCGGFLCEPCTTWVLGEVYCPTCAALPEVNYLERFRQGLWGRRDSWAWSLGFLGLGLVGPGGVLVVHGGEPQLGGFLLAGAAVGVGYFFRQGWARGGLLVLPGVLGVAGVVRGRPEWVVPAVLLFVQGLAIRSTPRHRLFFRLPVPDAVLLRLWDRYENNPLARVALSFGVYGLVLPLFAPVALGLGAVALRRVDAEGTPPIGRRGQALAAMGLGAGSVALWVALFWPRLSALLGELWGAG